MAPLSLRWRPERISLCLPPDIAMTPSDEQYMQLALAAAADAEARDEVPVGAVVVQMGK